MGEGANGRSTAYLVAADLAQNHIEMQLIGDVICHVLY